MTAVLLQGLQLLTVTVFLILSLTNVGASPSAASDDNLEPEVGALFGAYVEPRGGWTDAQRRQSLIDHEESIGRNVDIANEFFPFHAAWDLDRLVWHVDSGRIPMVSWNGTVAADILSGQKDGLIRSRAAQARAIPGQFFLRFFWEPDSSKGDTWGYHDDPDLYIQVWRHVRQLFADEGATNAVWVWTPTSWHFSTGFAQQFYPGDAHVDWIGADGYLWNPCRTNGEKSFEEIYEGFFDWAADRPKPAMAAEWGVGESAAKAAFITSAAEAVSRHPNLNAIVYFDADDPSGNGCNWTIDSSGSALEAYRQLGASAGLNTRTELPPPSSGPTMRAATADGWVVVSGSASHVGDARGLALVAPIVDLAPTPTGAGYWLVGSDGGIFAYGDAGYHGRSHGGTSVAIATTPSGTGYWLARSTGKVKAYGSAVHRGDAANLALAAPIVTMASTPDGSGYWLFAADGGVFAYGSAGYYGAPSAGAGGNDNIVAAEVTASGLGYWIVASDGTVWSYGDATPWGSGGQNIIDIVATAGGHGYWLISANGAATGFGGASSLIVAGAPIAAA